MASKCDIVYLAKGREEFTRESLAALAANTNWERVSNILIFSDGAVLPTGPIPGTLPFSKLGIDTCSYGGPVGVMLAYIGNSVHETAPLWAKIDNDVIVPPGWLDSCLDVMDAHPELDLLGIEPPLSRTPAPWEGNRGQRAPAPERVMMARDKWGMRDAPSYALCNFVGGIGMFRTRAFQGRPPMRPHSVYGGFTDWQMRQASHYAHGARLYPPTTQRPPGAPMSPLVIGWIVPPLKLFLLDRMPMEPWASLSKRYIAYRQQRPWTNYTEAEARELAAWWLK